MNSRGNSNPLDMDHPNKATGRDIVQMLVDRGANPNQQIYYRAAGRGFGGGTGRGTTPFLVGLRHRRHRDREAAARPRRQSEARDLRWPGTDHPRGGLARRAAPAIRARLAAADAPAAAGRGWRG